MTEYKTIVHTIFKSNAEMKAEELLETLALQKSDLLEKHRTQIRYQIIADYRKLNPDCTETDLYWYMIHNGNKWVNCITRIPATDSIMPNERATK